jgi:UDP-N-acetylmuramyl pentapeptide synthase
MPLAVRLRRFRQLLATGVGRTELWFAALNKAWPLLAPVAAAHRRLLGRHTRLVVVVGSFGKTTTTRCIAAALGLPRRELRDNCRSHLAMAALLRTGFRRHAVLEVGIDHPGQMAEYARVLRPDVVVVTSIGSEHGRSLGKLQGTVREKSKMVAALRPDGLAVLNGDDPNVLAMRDATPARAVTYGLGQACEVRGSGVALGWPRGTRFLVEAGDERLEIASRLLGERAVYPALAALAVAQAMGVPLAAAAARLATVKPAPGRLQPVPLPGGATLIRDEFKSAEETIHAALDLLATVPAGRRIVVLGDVNEPRGSEGPIYRAIGARVAAIAEVAVLVGRKATSGYSAGAVARGMPRSAVHKTGHDTAAAAELLRGLLQPGDVVLIEGRGDQRLERVALALTGRAVRCDRTSCHFLKTRCDTCSLLGCADAARRTRHVFPWRE